MVVSTAVTQHIPVKRADLFGGFFFGKSLEAFTWPCGEKPALKSA